MNLLTGFSDEAADGIQGQIAVLKKLGWSAIELRAVDKVLAHDLPEEAFAKVVDSLDKNGITVACLGSGIANWGTSLLQPFDQTKATVVRTVERMRRLHTNLVRIMSYKVIQDQNGRVEADQLLPERFERMNWICQTFLDQGITPVHENCHTFGGLSYEHTLLLLEKVPGLKLVFDTGNPSLTVDARKPFPYPMQDSLEFYHMVKDHIVHVHIKDSYLDKDGHTERYCFPGEGNGHIKEIVGDLTERGYSGYYSIEPHMEVVFHDDSAKSTDTRRIANFLTYGTRFETMLSSVGTL
ncbi:MAG: sugar phosphate isomerase/epimerase family protein [Sphaerochaeta sp.]